MFLLQATPIATTYTDIGTILFLCVLASLAFLKIRYPERFALFLVLPTTKVFFSVKRKKYRLHSSFNLILLLISATLVGLLGLLLLKEKFLLDVNPYVILTQLSFGYLLFVLTKYCIEKIIGDVFSIDSILDRYIFIKLTYRHYFLLLLILPLCIFLNYTDLEKSLLPIIVLSIFLIFNTLFLISYYRKKRAQIFKNLFYFILYLCALEIAPYLILYKVLTS